MPKFLARSSLFVFTSLVAMSANAGGKFIPSPHPYNPCIIDQNSYGCALNTYDLGARDQQLSALFVKSPAGQSVKEAVVLYMFRSSLATGGNALHNAEAQARQNSSAAFQEVQRVLGVWPASLPGERQYLLQLATRLNVPSSDKFNLLANEIRNPLPGSVDGPARDSVRLVAVQRSQDFEPHPGDVERALNQVLTQEPAGQNQVILLKHYEASQPDSARRLAGQHRISLPINRPIKHPMPK